MLPPHANAVRKKLFLPYRSMNTAVCIVLLDDLVGEVQDTDAALRDVRPLTQLLCRGRGSYHQASAEIINAIHLG